MNQAKISEIFLSYQGEGPFTGSRQLFIRFYGCNLNCSFCDTPLESYKSFSKEALLGKVLDFEDDYNELTLTGGEPLLHVEFLKDFLPLFKKHRRHKIYLETNGTLPEELQKIIGDIDIISMDFKLPSSTCIAASLWDVHRDFATLAGSKDLVIKAVITDSTTMDDVKEMGRILASLNNKDAVLVLQPVTPVNDLVNPVRKTFSNGVKEPDQEMLSYFKAYLVKATAKEVRILGQAHRYVGVK